MSGTLAFVGGAEWQEGCTFDASLLAASGGTDVTVLPTAAAYEHPERAVESATRWFEGLGAKVRGLMVLRRPDAEDATNAAAVRDSGFLYLSGGSPMHLRSVLKSSAVWEALVDAMALCDPMVDPRGGAFTVGLGLIEQLAFIPHHDTWSPDKARRTIDLAPRGLPLLAVDERTAVLRSPDGEWSVEGAGAAVVFVDGRELGIDALPR
jgi:cyanophycinase